MPDDDSSTSVSDQGVADIIVQAFRMYRAHARSLLITCALLFVPASLAKSCALATISPTLTAEYTRQAAEIPRARRRPRGGR